MIKLQIIGNVGKDAEIRPVGDNQVLEFTVCHTEKWNTADGPKEKAVWVKVTKWFKANDTIAVAQYLKTGQKVYCEGTPDVRGWLDTKNLDAANQPTPRGELSMKCINIELLGGGTATGTSAAAAPAKPATPPPPPKQVWNADKGVWEQEAAVSPPAGGFNAGGGDDLPF